MKKKEKQDIERTVLLGVAGREGSMELTDFNEFWRVFALMNFLQEAEEDFNERVGREVDLGCSIDMLRKVANAPEKNRIFLVEEMSDNMRYEARCVDNVPFNEAAEEIAKAAKEFGIDLYVSVKLEDGREMVHPSIYEYQLLKAKPKAEEMWNAVLKVKGK